MHKTKIIITTCAQWPDVSTSDQLFVEALTKRGFSVESAPWNGDQAQFHKADIVVLRSNWDYHLDPGNFVQWLDEVAKQKTIFNKPSLVKWNLNKKYIFELMDAGVRIPKTYVVKAEHKPISEKLVSLGWELAVIKPLVGASGHNVEIINCSEKGDLARKVSTFLNENIMLQEFIPEIKNGEISAVFFNGTFSHAVLKKPAPGDFRSNGQHNATRESVYIQENILKQVANVLTTLPETPLYARVDVVLRGDKAIIMELELNEPHLFLDFDSQASERFADALVSRLT